jgi:hypothetical protein
MATFAVYEPMLTMEPAPARSINEIAYFEQRKTPRTFTFISRTQSSPKTKELGQTDPRLTTLLSACLRANIGVGSRLDRKN